MKKLGSRAGDQPAIQFRVIPRAASSCGAVNSRHHSTIGFFEARYAEAREEIRRTRRHFGYQHKAAMHKALQM
jgi:hypothetical protein